MAINVGDNFSYQGKKYLDNRQSFKTLSELQAYANVPEGFIAYCEENKKRYEYVDGEWVEFTVDASVDVDTSIYAEKAYVDELIKTHTHDEYLTEHQDISHLATKEEIPSLDGLATETYVQEQIANAELDGEEVDLSHLVTKDELEQKGYLTEHQDISHLATKEEIPSLEGLATETYVREQIANAELGGEGPSIDTSNFATKDELKTKFDDVEVNEEETTDSQTALDFFANGEKVKTVYFSGGGGGGGAAAYISTTLEENVMVETGFNFDILIDFYSPNPGKGTLKVFVNDVDALSTPITQGESTTTLSYEKLSKGTNKIVVYVLDRIGTMSNSLTFYVRYGSTELVGEFDSSLAYDYGANIRYYFTATALDTSLGLTFYMSIDGALQNGVSCVSDVRGYFTFPNSLEAGGHYCECWVEDSNGGKSNVESFNLVILDTNTLAIVTETRNPSVEEGSQLVLDYRVYKKNETTFIIKTYVDEELISTGTCGLTTSYYKTTTLREGMHNIKIEAWDITETVSDYITWSVIITPSTYTMLEPINAGSIFIASAKNRTNGDPNRETWTGYNQDKNAIDASLYNFAFNSESGWMDDQLFITGNSYVEVPIQPLANNARYGFTLDIEFSAKPIGVDDAEVLSLWNDVDNCGIKITTDQLILQSKTGNKCELYFSENEIVSAIFIIDRHEKTAKVYLNGVMCAAFALSDYTAEGVSYLEDFTVNGNLYLGKPGSNGYATIKNLRIYELALSSSEILNNFMANEIDKAKQQALVNFQKGEDLPTVTVYCDFSGLGKDDKKYCDIVYNSPDPVKYGESFSLMGKYSQLQYQGTSSMQYPIKNYRLNPRDANGKVKIKLPFSQPESRFTLKADFMASGHWQNTGLTKWVNDNLYNYNENDEKSMNPAKWWAVQNGLDHNMYRECIYGFPCRLILVNDGNSSLNEGQQEPTPGNTKDMGIFNFNLDKECENTLGFTNDAFPNAVSMEVTANSDTSAGAFMSFIKNQYNLGRIGEGFTTLIPLDVFGNTRTLSMDSLPASALLVEYNDAGANLTYGTTVNQGDVFKLKDATTKIRMATSVYGDTDKFTISGITFINALGQVSELNKEEPLYCTPVVADGSDELAYLQESFELRYGNEDIDGWGFLDIDGDTSLGLKALIDWVDKSTDEQFVAEFEEHFHKDYTLRYYLLVIVLGMVDNLGKNMMLDSYDGKIWMPRFYDCDTICSYDNSGAIKFDVDIEMAQGYWNTSSSRLWTRVRDLFHDELVVKYNDMRQNGMSYENFMKYFYDEQIAKIPQKYYNQDADVKYLPYADDYLGKAHGDGYEHLKRWLKNRLIFTDSLYDYAPSYTNDMLTIRANTTELMNLTIETYTPVYQHVSWYNGNMQKEKIAKGSRFTFSGHAQSATDQEVLIYGGSNIKRIIGISSMNPDSMLIGNATRLVELDISGCPILTDINSNKANLSAHTYLNKLDISNCPQLGGSLRLNYSPLIGEINAMNTAVTDLQLPSSIRNLHTLKVPGALKSLALNDAPVLATLEFDGPNQLESVSMTNCNALVNVVNFDMTQIPVVTLNNSYDVDELYMSKTTNLSLVNMSKVNKLIFVPNNEHAVFNLTELRNSPDYTITAINCPNLKSFMTTAPYRKSYGLSNESDNERYIPLEYIETDMSQYIETDYHVNNKTKVVADMHVMEFMEWGYMFGSNNMRVQFNSKGEIPLQGFTIEPSGGIDVNTTRQTWVVMAASIGLDPQPFHIFSGSTSQNIYRVAARLYSMKIYEDDALVRDYIPCIEKQTQTVCLYDAINDNFVYPAVGKLLSPADNAVGAEAFCANTLDISNTKITDVNFLCTTDIYQLKLPDTVNNFICDSAFDLDTDYLPDGDFDMVHHDYIEAYTTDYSDNIYKYNDAVYEFLYSNLDTLVSSGELVQASGWDTTNNTPILTTTGTEYITVNPISVTPGTEIQFNATSTSYSRSMYEFDSDGNHIRTQGGSQKLLTLTLGENTAFVRFRLASFNNAKGYQIICKERLTPNLIPSAADGSLIFSMYAPTVNSAAPAEGIWDLYGLTFEEFYTYGMNNDIILTDGVITMPHRYPEYDITIQNANISPTNYPTMLYPLLVNEDKPILGAIDYSNYKGDDLSYAMAYANRSEVDITIPANVMINSNYIYNIDRDSEYAYFDPRTIAKYTSNASGVVPTFNTGYAGYIINEENNGDGTYTTAIIADTIDNLPSKINFEEKTALLTVEFLNTSNITDMTRMFYGCTNVTSINTSDWDTSKVTTIERVFTQCGKLKSIDVSGWDTKNITNMGFAFHSCSSLTSLDVSEWDTSNVTTISEMFYQCKAITSLDVTGWDTREMTGMRNVFYYCQSLTSLDLSGWKTDNVTTMQQMFQQCTALNDIDVSGWNTSNVTTMQSMFDGCSSLTSLDVSNWDMGKVTNAAAMFQGCSNLSEIIGLDTWYCPKLSKVGSMFQACISLVAVDASSWKRGENGESTISEFFSFCNIVGSGKLEYIDISGFVLSTDNLSSSLGRGSVKTIRWTNWEKTTDLSANTGLTAESVKDLLANLATVTTKPTLTLSQTSSALLSSADILAAQMKGWTVAGANISVAIIYAEDTISGNDVITECAIQLTNANYRTRINEVLTAYTSCSTIHLFDNGDVTSLSYALDANGVGDARTRISHVSIIPGSFGGVTNAGEMMRTWTHTYTVNLSGWNTSSLVNVPYMFMYCEGLTSADLSGWDTSNITNMSYMFVGNRNLTTLKIPDTFVTKSTTNTASMFQNCSGLTSLDVSKWNTSNVTNMANMFTGCSSLTSLDVSGWDTSSTTSMANVFQGCTLLASLDVSGWNTAKVTNMSYTFSGCKALTSLNLSNWDLGEVTTIRWMFSNCSELVDLDIRGWDTSNVTIFGGNGGGIFQNCSKLKSDKFPVFDFSKATSATRMFEGCNSITELHFKNMGSYRLFIDGDYSNGRFLDLYSGSSLTTVTGLNLTSMIESAYTTTHGIIYAYHLENLSIEGTISTSFKITADNLSHDSLMNIINALVTLEGTTKTLIIGYKNVAKLTSAEIAIGTNKGWTIY